jgi:hypothetical protein
MMIGWLQIQRGVSLKLQEQYPSTNCSSNDFLGIRGVDLAEELDDEVVDDSFVGNGCHHAVHPRGALLAQVRVGQDLLGCVGQVLDERVDDAVVLRKYGHLHIHIARLQNR